MIPDTIKIKRISSVFSGDNRSMCDRAISRLFEIFQRNFPLLTKEGITICVTELIQCLGIIESSKRSDYLFPQFQDELWKLAILDTDYYPYLCLYVSVQMGKCTYDAHPFVLTYNPIISVNDHAGSLKAFKSAYRRIFPGAYCRLSTEKSLMEYGNFIQDLESTQDQNIGSAYIDDEQE